MSQTIAIIEDEPDLAQNYREALEREGFNVVVFADGVSARKDFERSLPDLAIVDIELGDDKEGGYMLCAYLRERSATLPVVFLTARDSELDEVMGLKLGANEYLTKGISMQLLTLRVTSLLSYAAALLRFGEDGGEGEMVECGSLRLDLTCRTASWKGQRFQLTATEFAMVQCLADRPGHIKSRDQLMVAADKVIAQESVNTHIKRIRKKIRTLDPGANPIRSEHSLGYTWVAEQKGHD